MLKLILTGSFWGILSKIFDALFKFITVPLLVAHYGKGDYGLIVLAFTLNAYLRIMDLGMNIGSIRFFSIWIKNDQWHTLSKVSRSSVTFYGIVGILNALLFLYLSYNLDLIFEIDPNQTEIFAWVLRIMAIGSIFNWISSVLIQLLSANEELSWINGVAIVSSSLAFGSALLSIKFNISLTGYFILFTISTLSVFPFYLYKLREFPLEISKLLSPIWDWLAYKEVWSYSIAIFIMSVFQFTANNIRPLLLNNFASQGISVMTDYRVLQTIVMLLLAFGSVFTQVLLPSVSKLYESKDKKKLDDLVYNGTKYLTVFFSFIVFPIIINAEPLLKVYMGIEYGELSLWLILWCLTAFLIIHNTPISSLVLASGKTRALVYSSAISCIISIPITILLAETLNVGAAVIGYLVYVLIQIGFYYFYYIPKVLGFNSTFLFINSFLFPSALGGIAALLIYYFNDVIFHDSANLFRIFLNTILFIIIYSVLLKLFVLKKHEFQRIKNTIV